MTSAGVEIRDWDQCSIASPKAVVRHHLEVRMWQVGNGLNRFADFWDSVPDLSDPDGFYVAPGGNLWVAQRDAAPRVVGCLALQRTGLTSGEVKRFAVRPDCQGQGIGTSLVDALMGWARSAGYTDLTLTTGRRETARPIYERFGFSVTGEVPPTDWAMRADLRVPARVYA